MGNADGVGQLDLTLVSQSGRYNILSNIAGCVGCRAVYLGAVLSRECAAAMACRSAIGINDDLASGQAAVAVRAADHKTSGRIDEKFCILIYHICRDNGIKYILPDICVNLLLCHVLIMLSREHHCIQTGRTSVLVVLHRNLCLSVRAQIL